ncbi:hypothetical protein KQ304_07695 [Synechococcus sp. CS-1329]|uniref:hypothetical protein n=1 Tax=Synechococcus sp. CS-1329 TaxID=2847975 RepID=UPI00223AB2C8|nr:hypothetical protein [Synechococcus sp. CS-1329]MCT0218881.1 hypothetical protein [Synechococcus sp. CS-1329]
MVLSSSWTGSAGNDSFRFDQSDVTALTAIALGGDDTLDLYLNSEGSSVEGGDGNDGIDFFRPSDYTGSQLSNIIATTVEGGNGNDSISVDRNDFNLIQDSVFQGNAGSDSIFIEYANTLINTSVWGGQGDDTMTLFFNNVIQGGGYQWQRWQ